MTQLCKCGEEEDDHRESLGCFYCPCKKFTPQITTNYDKDNVKYQKFTPQELCENCGKSKEVHFNGWGRHNHYCSYEKPLKKFTPQTPDTSDFNLSEKRRNVLGVNYIMELDVKEFIKETREDIEGGYEGEELLRRFKKRAGDDLIK